MVNLPELFGKKLFVFNETQMKNDPIIRSDRPKMQPCRIRRNEVLFPHSSRIRDKQERGVSLANKRNPIKSAHASSTPEIFTHFANHNKPGAMVWRRSDFLRDLRKISSVCRLINRYCSNLGRSACRDLSICCCRTCKNWSSVIVKYCSLSEGYCCWIKAWLWDDIRYDLLGSNNNVIANKVKLKVT